MSRRMRWRLALGPAAAAAPPGLPGERGVTCVMAAYRSPDRDLAVPTPTPPRHADTHSRTDVCA
eukprot:7115307-Prymnesium_polylepis.1